MQLAAPFGVFGSPDESEFIYVCPQAHKHGAHQPNTKFCDAKIPQLKEYATPPPPPAACVLQPPGLSSTSHGLFATCGIAVSTDNGPVFDTGGGGIVVWGQVHGGRFRHTSNFGAGPLYAGNFNNPDPLPLVDNRLCETLGDP